MRPADTRRSTTSISAASRPRRITGGVSLIVGSLLGGGEGRSSILGKRSLPRL
jgi:hypothetical protein